MKKTIFAKAVVLILTVVLLVFLCPTVSRVQPGFTVPENTSALMIFPPLCFIKQMYSGTDDLTPTEILSSPSVTVKPRLRIVEAIAQLWNRLV